MRIYTKISEKSIQENAEGHEADVLRYHVPQQIPYKMRKILFKRSNGFYGTH